MDTFVLSENCLSKWSHWVMMFDWIKFKLMLVGLLYLFYLLVYLIKNILPQNTLDYSWRWILNLCFLLLVWYFECAVIQAFRRSETKLLDKFVIFQRSKILIVFFKDSLSLWLGSSHFLLSRRIFFHFASDRFGNLLDLCCKISRIQTSS